VSVDGTLSAVLFDMDGLLVDTEPLWLRAEIATMAELGARWTEADQRAILGGSLAQAAHYFKEASGTGMAPARIADMLVTRMLAELGTAEIPIQPGAADLLAEVAASGVPRALVSASVRPIVDVVLSAMAASGLPGFAVTIAGDDVERGKPDPEPYRRAGELLGIDVQRAVVLEDSPNGVRSGVAAGATVVAVPHAVPIDPAPRVHVRGSLVGLDLAGLRALAAR
jgi:HAD superfamily hydrolase (TIGR01509 family)